MTLLDSIAGFSHNAQTLDRIFYSERLESQRVRVSQSHLSLYLVVVVGVIYIAALWNQVPPQNVIAWIGLCILTAFLRMAVCKRIEKSLDNLTIATLYRNEVWFYFTSTASTAAMGTGYWFVCLGASDRVVFTVTLLTCVYAIGSTVNSAMHARNIPSLLISNLGQGIVFLLFFRDPPNIETAFALTALVILLIQFCRRISALFTESFHIRDENMEKNLLLEQQKLVVENALQEARNANDDKNRFMAAASHDLRQPLHAITLFLGSLRHLVTTERAISLVQKIDEATSILHEQFNSLLDLSKFDAGVVEPNLERGSLDVVLEHVYSNMLPLAQQKDIQLICSPVPWEVVTDFLLLERLIQNIVINGIKFTDQGEVRIGVEVDDEMILLSITDTGCGIDQEEQSKIFMDYYQVHNRARTKGKGSGLGLAIVKRIAALLGYDLSLHSVPGQGSTFTVAIPRLQSARSAGMETGQQPRDSMLPGMASSPVGEVLEGLHVLIVDDDPQILDALAGLVQDWGGKVTAASSFEAVRRAMETQGIPEFAILDDMLNEHTSGLDIAVYLRQWMPQSSIMIVTGNTVDERIAVLHGAGFDVLIKPVDRQELLAFLLRARNSRPTTAS